MFVYFIIRACAANIDIRERSMLLSCACMDVTCTRPTAAHVRHSLSRTKTRCDDRRRLLYAQLTVLIQIILSYELGLLLVGLRAYGGVDIGREPVFEVNFSVDPSKLVWF